jgi:hypothetical protein
MKTVEARVRTLFSMEDAPATFGYDVFDRRVAGAAEATASSTLYDEWNAMRETTGAEVDYPVPRDRPRASGSTRCTCEWEAPGISRSDWWMSLALC